MSPSSHETLNQRLQAALAQRDSLQGQKKLLEGRLQQAQESLQKLQEECRAKGIDPENLDAVVQRLREKYLSELDAFEADLSAAAAKLATYNSTPKGTP